MEGNQVGTSTAGMPQDQNSNTPVHDADVSSGMPKLLWPLSLIRARWRVVKPHDWSTILAIVNMIMVTLIGIALGPGQLIVLATTEDYITVTEGYYPTALRIALLISGVSAIMAIITMIRIWSEQPKHTRFTVLLTLGALIIDAFIWLSGFIISLEPDQLTLLLMAIILLVWILAILSLKQLLPAPGTLGKLKAGVTTIIVIASAELALSGIYILQQPHELEQAEIELEELTNAQLAARLEGVTEKLSDLTFEVCQGTYEVVYIPEDQPSTGLFQCYNNTVYSVSEPIDAVQDSSTIAFGQAFYFGTTSDESISVHFPSELNFKYLYRDLTAAESPSELVMLLPATTEENLIDGYLERILNFVNTRDPKTELKFSIFYNEFLDNVQTTKDFILIAAIDTIAMNTWLPNGANIRGPLNGVMGTYLFTPDLRLNALNSLAMSPLLYASQTRDAINSRRHLTFVVEPDREYTADELRDLLWASWVDPVAA